MFSLVEFSDFSRAIYALKNIKKLNGNTCIVKHSGCKYEASIIASDDSRQKLEEILKNLVTESSFTATLPCKKPTIKSIEKINPIVIIRNQKQCQTASMTNISSSNSVDESQEYIVQEDCSLKEISNQRDSSFCFDSNNFQTNESANDADDEYTSDVDMDKNMKESCTAMGTDVSFVGVSSISDSHTDQNLIDKISADETYIMYDESYRHMDINKNVLDKFQCNMVENDSVTDILIQANLQNQDVDISDSHVGSLLSNLSTVRAENLPTSTPENITNDAKEKKLEGNNIEVTEQKAKLMSELVHEVPSNSKIFNEDNSNEVDVDDPTYEPHEENNSDSATDPEQILEDNTNQCQTYLEKSSNISSGIDASISCNPVGIVTCDDTELYVEKSRGPRGDNKKNVCFYCHKKQSKIARHLELKHADEEEVKKFVTLQKNCQERRKIIEIIRKRGNFIFNTRKDINDGELIVSRRPNIKFNRTASEFKACGNCKAYFAKSSLRTHFKKCTKKSSKTTRVVMVMSKRVMGRIHSRASETVKKELFPVLREDDVVRLIRYDELVIIYANYMCEKYKNPRFFEMIRQRMRLIGRFLLTIKKLNKEVGDLASVYDPKFSDDTLRAINIEAGLDNTTKHYKAPTVAFNLGTLLKQIGTMLINEHIKMHNEVERKNTKDFIKLLTQDVTISINRTVVESQTQQKRRKIVELPSMQDIKKLHVYLKEKRNKAFKALEQEFSGEAWLTLAETTLTSIQLFNRRRAGEVERILIDDFKCYQGINENTDSDLFKSLSLKHQEIAKKYVRFAIRGKLNRTVSVLLNSELLKCVELLLSNRKNAKVCNKNPYVFGIRGGDKLKYKYLRACILMRKFSSECGATHPERLRGTKLRKHIATACIALNLSEHEVGDLANFMGHGEKIHKDIYRQPLVNREILRMSKLLETAQGANEEDNDESDNDPDEDDNDIEENDEIGVNTSNLQLDENENIRIVKNKENNSIKRKRSTSPYGSVKRVPWTSVEKKTALRVFNKNLENNKLPSLKDIQQAITDYPSLRNRRPAQIKTWLHNQTKAKKKLCFAD